MSRRDHCSLKVASNYVRKAYESDADRVCKKILLVKLFIPYDISADIINYAKRCMRIMYKNNNIRVCNNFVCKTAHLLDRQKFSYPEGSQVLV